MFNYNYLFNDHFAKCSNEAKLLYIKMNFYAVNGFVPNPIQILDSMGYDKGVYNELILSGEIMTIPNREEVFITSYFLHNPGINPKTWRNTPFAIYWKGKLHIKKNRIATFRVLSSHDNFEEEHIEIPEYIEPPTVENIQDRAVIRITHTPWLDDNGDDE